MWAVYLNEMNTLETLYTTGSVQRLTKASVYWEKIKQRGKVASACKENVFADRWKCLDNDEGHICAR